MTAGLILAGGRGSRMGPLAAQISKALVSIGQRPHLAHQVELLREHGVDKIVVVVSPDTERQVGDMIDRSGLRNVQIYTQRYANGPVGAIHVGLAKALHHKVVDYDEPLYVLMSDTFLDDRLPAIDPEQIWAATSEAPSMRSFCVPTGVGYADKVVEAGTMVTIGLYGFPTVQRAANEAHDVMRDHQYEDEDEVGMAPFLAGVKAVPLPTTGWQDIGDLTALARARRDKFVARAHHRLELNEYGVITKLGSGESFEKQVDYLQWIEDENPRMQTLFPRIYGSSSEHLSMEYIDMPTLAELWLYWPGRPDTWADILQSILERMAPMWGASSPAVHGPNERTIFVDKAKERLRHTRWSRIFDDRLDKVASLFDVKPPKMVTPHGDLNFNNILMSLNSGTIKLIDPRGDFCLPVSYEIAKLRYSYNGGFAAITHNLYDAPENAVPVLLPNRREEAAAMDRVLAPFASMEKLTAAEACLLLAGSTMHEPTQARVMRSRANDLLEELGA